MTCSSSQLFCNSLLPSFSASLPHFHAESCLSNPVRHQQSAAQDFFNASLGNMLTFSRRSSGNPLPIITSPSSKTRRSSSFYLPPPPTGSKTRKRLSTDIRTTKFYKTKLCPFLTSECPGGKCSQGLDCGFAHDVSELRMCPDLWRTKWCPSVLGATSCPDPANCGYAHTASELRRPRGSNTYKTSLCLFWLRGKQQGGGVVDGNNGLCLNGSKCRFAHGYEELSENAFFRADNFGNAILPPAGSAAFEALHHRKNESKKAKKEGNRKREKRDEFLRKSLLTTWIQGRKKEEPLDLPISEVSSSVSTSADMSPGSLFPRACIGPMLSPPSLERSSLLLPFPATPPMLLTLPPSFDATTPFTDSPCNSIPPSQLTSALCPTSAAQGTPTNATESSGPQLTGLVANMFDALFSDTGCRQCR